MDKKTKTKFKKKLLAIREKLVDELGIIESSNFGKNTKEATGELSSYSLHMADSATDSMDREQAFRYHSREGKFLHHVVEALKRIDQGNYGNCLKCEKPIPLARLEIVPNARHCIKCKNSDE